ncbi:hypothetical protein [Desulfatitalea tepidiphila]|uniref:hypothetical protein n=1 Tax=Desulfatitalea tepidiphila TaxID=1185843 RepID=UPI0006B65A1E|nr:hypothetical protein [Desulfatitalea tepidiphila]
MKKETLKEAVKEAIVELMATPEGRAAFGPVVFDSVGQYIQNFYELDLEKHHGDGTVERVKQRGDILIYIAEWIGKAEGALRGVQSDAGRAMNRAREARDMVGALVGHIARGRGQAPAFGPDEILNKDGVDLIG